MSGVWARTLVYLGLREEPEDHVEWDVLAAADTGDVAVVPDPQRAPSARPVSRPPDPVAPVSNVRAIRAADAASDPGPAAERVAVVQVLAFDDVEAVGANHRDGRPVLIDVTACERAVARRVVDFVAGMTYVSGGSFRRLTQGAFLLLPAGVDLDPAERERLARLGLPLDPPAGPR